MRWVLVLFVVVPLVELYLLLQLAALIDFWPTVAIVLVTGVVGGTLAKMEGSRVWRAWRRALDTMTPPEQGVLDGVLVLIGGALLITPGVLTDLVGLSMLIPWSRRRIAGRMRKIFERGVASGHVHVIDSSFPQQPRQAGPFPRDVPPRPVQPPSSRVVETTGETVED